MQTCINKYSYTIASDSKNFIVEYKKMKKKKKNQKEK